MEGVAYCLSMEPKNSGAEHPFVDTTFRVRYAETDQMGVVHHANYFVWFEFARTEFCRKYGVDYRQMEAAGVVFSFVEVWGRHTAAARVYVLVSLPSVVD